MKKSNKGFTLVELIIVIAVIGVLAAILIPVFSNVIEKANRKSAFSDAKNALSIYLAENTSGEGGVVVTEGSEFYAKKAGKFYHFTYQNSGLVEDTADAVDALPAAPAGAKTIIGKNTETGVTTGSEVANFPTTVVLYLAPAA